MCKQLSAERSRALPEAVPSPYDASEAQLSAVYFYYCFNELIMQSIYPLMFPLFQYTAIFIH